MTDEEIISASAATLAAQIHRGSLTATEVIEAFLARIEELNAFIDVARDQAREQAAQAYQAVEAPRCPRCRQGSLACRGDAVYQRVGWFQPTSLTKAFRSGCNSSPNDSTTISSLVSRTRCIKEWDTHLPRVSLRRNGLQKELGPVLITVVLRECQGYMQLYQTMRIKQDKTELDQMLSKLGVIINRE